MFLRGAQDRGEEGMWTRNSSEIHKGYSVKFRACGEGRYEGLGCNGENIVLTVEMTVDDALCTRT